MLPHLLRCSPACHRGSLDCCPEGFPSGHLDLSSPLHLRANLVEAFRGSTTFAEIFSHASNPSSAVLPWNILPRALRVFSASCMSVLISLRMIPMALTCLSKRTMKVPPSALLPRSRTTSPTVHHPSPCALSEHHRQAQLLIVVLSSGISASFAFLFILLLDEAFVKLCFAHNAKAPLLALLLLWSS